MNELGRLEDLPADYREALTQQNLVPLWPSLRGVLPPTKPQPRTRATAWSYQAIKPLLLRAGGPALDARVDALIEQWNSGPYIFNLGHGISQYTPPEHVAHLVDEVHRHSREQRA